MSLRRCLLIICLCTVGEGFHSPHDPVLGWARMGTGASMHRGAVGKQGVLKPSF